MSAADPYPTGVPGGPAMAPARTLRHRLGLCGLLLLGCVWGRPAAAGALYHCTGPAGEAVLASTTAGYHACRRIDTPAPATRRRPARRVASLAGVGATVLTTARVPSTAAPGKTPPGSWSYRDSTRPRGAAATVAATGADRVLRGAVYRIVRADGSVEYTNQRPAGKPDAAVTMLFSYIATCAACNLHSTIDWAHVPLNLTAYHDAVHAASVESGVEEAFLRAVIHAESAFRPNALSLKGAQGLMQLMPDTASEVGVLDAFDARQNIRGGARYLARLLKTFGGSERLAAAAYNAGPGAVLRYNGVPPFDETRVYVRRVGELRRRYAAAVASTLARGAGSP